jgi:hypothetical protein
LKNLVGSRNTSSAFGKKWSLVSRTEGDEELDPKIMQFLTTIHRTLDEFKFPSKIIWHKSKYYSVDNWKTNTSDLQISELLMATISRIMALMKTCEKYIKCRPKSKRGKVILSSNRTLLENLDSRNE